MPELVDFLSRNVGNRVVLVTSSGIFGGGDVISASAKLVELGTVVQGLSVGAAAMSSLTIELASVTGWGIH